MHLRQLSERSAVEVCVWARANRGVGYVEQFAAELETIALGEAERLFERDVQLRPGRIPDVGESVRDRAQVERGKRFVTGLIVVEPVVLVLRGRVPFAAVVYEIGPGYRVAGQVGEDPVEAPIPGEGITDGIADVEFAARAERQVPEAAE